MAKRTIKFGDYDTAETGLWTLTGLSLSNPEQQTNYIEVPGRRGGLLDLSTAMTDGEPVYNSRTLKATFESSEGTRAERETRLNTMLNTLDGYSMKIILPDDTTHYLQGRLTVKKKYNDDAHASVEVSAVCEPWRYKTTAYKASATAAATKWVNFRMYNRGRASVVPTITIETTAADAAVKYNGATWRLAPGTYTIPAIVFPGNDTDGELVSFGNADAEVRCTFEWHEGEL